jgi:hypothetical protein
VDAGIKTPFWITNDGVLMMGQHMYLPNRETVKQNVLQEAHESKSAIHLGSTKIYQNLKWHY